MLDARTCSNCGSPLPARAPEGLCPHCLLRAGLGSEALSVGRSGEVSATLGLDSGVLETIAAALGPVPRVLLRDTDAGFEPPLIRPGRGDGTDASTRYRIGTRRRSQGRGHGLQCSRRATPDLGRDVAIKVLRTRTCWRQRRHGPPLHRRGPDRRPAPAPRDRADLRAGHLRRLPAVLLDEAGQGANPRRPAGGPPEAGRRAAPVPRRRRGRRADGGLRTRPGRDPPRSKTVECDGRLVRRGAGDGLGPRQGPAPRRRGR